MTPDRFFERRTIFSSENFGPGDQNFQDQNSRDRTPVFTFKRFYTSFSYTFKYPTVVNGSLASLALRISAVKTSLIVASTAFVHGGPASEVGKRAYKAVTPLR